jgi:hypothetical protein
MSGEMPAGDLQRSSARTWSWAAAVLVAALFLARGLLFLYRTHPQEDAYILFGYVKRFVAGDGIVFYPGGPRAEGATDFLWFLLLSALHSIGIDIALAAELLNAAGGAVLGGLIGAAVLGGRTGVAAPLLLLALLPAALAGAAVAAIVGFSSLFFSAVAGVCLVLTLRALSESPSRPAGDLGPARWIPPATLVLALIRPDGVVLGACFALVGWIAAARSGRARGYLARCLVAAAIGAAYFAWRWSYFGLPLPLPLYAKYAAREAGADLLADPAAFFPGAEMNLGWLQNVGGGWPLLAALAVVLLFRKVRASDFALVALPFVVHLVALGVARQSQNVAFRFQAPAQTALLLLLVLAAAATARALASNPMRLLVGLVVALGAGPSIVFASLSRKGLAAYEGERSYVDVFGPRLGAILEPKDGVVLCDQAGRIPYWSRARMYDMVGLNTARTALAPPDAAYLASLDADVVLVYLAKSVSDIEDRLRGTSESVVPIDGATLAASVKPEYRELFEHGLAEYGKGVVPDRACNVITSKYLVDSGAYDLYAVRYLGTFRHVYGIRRGFPRAAAIVDALREAERPESYLSYAEIVGFPGARRLDDRR